MQCRSNGVLAGTWRQYNISYVYIQKKKIYEKFHSLQFAFTLSALPAPPIHKKNEPREHKIADNDKAIFFIFLCVNSEPPLQSSQKIAEIGSIF